MVFAWRDYFARLPATTTSAATLEDAYFLALARWRLSGTGVGAGLLGVAPLVHVVLAVLPVDTRATLEVINLSYLTVYNNMSPRC